MTDRSIWYKTGLGKLWGSTDRNQANKAANKVGAESFWPASIDRESYKAARILRSFCKDGLHEETNSPSLDGGKQRQRVTKKIPAEVIRDAKGLAIFTTMRSGLWVSGAGGSGVLVARLPDGGWSPPSGILLHTAALGFIVGVDIYDCVLVLNTVEALNAFAKWRTTIGGELSVITGPLGIGGKSDMEYPQAGSIYTYLRTRGFSAGAHIDGTVVVERTAENEKYYGYRYSASEIISGKVRNPPSELRTLFQTLKVAQGDHDADHSALPTEPPPSDLEVVHSDYVFGVPDKEDPDPFGVLALEKEGLLIREAGTRTAVPSEVFDFKPNPTSPIFDTYNGRTFSDKDKQESRRSSWRNSTVTIHSVDRPRYVTMDISTQTDFEEPTSPGASEFARTLSMDKNNLPSTPSGLPGTPPSLPRTPPRGPLRSPSVVFNAAPGRPSPVVSRHGSVESIRSTFANSAAARKDSKLENLIESMSSDSPPETFSMPRSQHVRVLQKPSVTANECHDEDGSVDDDDDLGEDEEPVIFESIQQAPPPRAVVYKPRMVTIPRHMRPELPTRNPSRSTRLSNSDNEITPTGDQVSTSSMRSLSLSQDDHQRQDSFTSITTSLASSVKQRPASFQSFSSQHRPFSMRSVESNGKEEDDTTEIAITPAHRPLSIQSITSATSAIEVQNNFNKLDTPMHRPHSVQSLLGIAIAPADKDTTETLITHNNDPLSVLSISSPGTEQVMGDEVNSTASSPERAHSVSLIDDVSIAPENNAKSLAPITNASIPAHLNKEIITDDKSQTTTITQISQMHIQPPSDESIARGLEGDVTATAQLQTVMLEVDLPLPFTPSAMNAQENIVDSSDSPMTEPSPSSPTHASEAPAREDPAKESPAKVSPARVSPAKVSLAKVSSAKESPAKESPAKESPAKESPAKEASAKEASAKEASAKEASAKEASANDASANDASAKEAIAKEPPAKEASAIEVTPSNTPIPTYVSSLTTNQSAAPRISLLSMKLGLSDDDDDDDEDTQPARSSLGSLPAPRKARLQSLDYNFQAHDDLNSS